VPKAAGLYVPARRAGTLVYTAGQLPFEGGELAARGAVGRDVTMVRAAECARIAALNCLSAASTVCSLDDVDAVLKLTGYVASAEDFFEQPAVVNGASEVMSIAFGDKGAHARAAVGVCSLPLGAPVEIELVLLLREG
jgi:enamine deaminase RidA (YjgF/YER057c/UK114 family)